MEEYKNIMEKVEFYISSKTEALFTAYIDLETLNKLINKEYNRCYMRFTNGRKDMYINSRDIVMIAYTKDNRTTREELEKKMLDCLKKDLEYPFLVYYKED